ncbi:Tetratricopeptide repeat-containing protein [Streptomyces sp. 2323.1]|uniref:tetratricopeptide repeat protein n=1 Tax=Streptomyces sp. 2323.1 TaxID=1938841 RepID=UPI000BB6DA0E|nr:Tetratricopeptide repeat-containing protein [Streptomyces sp. 2323.1]
MLCGGRVCAGEADRHDEGWRLLRIIRSSLEHRAGALGPTHVERLGTRTNLAHAHAAVGDLERALPLCERMLRDRRKRLGPDHPETLASLSDLAHVYARVGDLERTLSPPPRGAGAPVPV